MFSTQYRFLIVLVLGVYSFLNTLSIEAFKYYEIKTNKWAICLTFVLLIYCIWEANHLNERRFLNVDKDNFWKKVTISFISTSLLTVLCTVLLGSLVLYFTISKNMEGWFVPLKLLLMFAFRINLFLSIIHVIFLYQRQLEKSSKEIESYKKITTQTQLQSLKNQLNPHFLFNNLSVLSELIAVDRSASEEFVKQFARVYRYVLNSHEKELIEIEEEMEFIKAYAYLLKTRFVSGLHININISNNIKNGYVLPMAIQMLLENAVKHNIISKSSPLILDIYDDDGGYIWVKNNLQPKQVAEIESNKVGLINIRKRYAHLGSKDIEIHESALEFKVAIPIITFSQIHPGPTTFFKKSA